MLSATTRGLKPKDLENVGKVIGGYLRAPDDEHAKALTGAVATLTATLPFFAGRWLPEGVSSEGIAPYGGSEFVADLH